MKLKHFMELSIIIVNWNVKDLLKKCIESIYQNVKDIDFEIFVVDNASPDGSAAYIKRLISKEGSGFSSVRVIENKKNLGFASANNQAIEQSRGEFVLLLNPDTEITENALERMIRFMKTSPQIGITGPKLINPDGSLQKSVRRFPTLASEILILLKLYHLFPKLKPLNTYFVHGFDYEKTQAVEQVVGAAFCIRREVIDSVGYFDENFYLWFEEVDYCKRARERGFKVVYYPKAAVMHYGGRSFSQVLNFKNQKIFNKSMAYYFKKHKPFWQYLIIQILRPAGLALVLLLQPVICLARSRAPKN